MAFIEFLKQNKDKDMAGDGEPIFPCYANRNVAKLLEQKFRRDSEPSERSSSTKNQTKRSSKSEENIFEKIEASSTTNGATTKRYGTMPKSKLIDDDDEELQKTSETESHLADFFHNRLKFRKNSVEFDPSTKRSNNSLDHQSSSTSSSTEYLDQSDRNKMMSSPQPNVMTDAQGLIVPKKLTNPCLESSDRQNLHRELMFNQKVGKNVLNQKSELQRALEKQKERQQLAAQQQKKMEDHNPKNIENELTKVIMQRAQRLENSQKENKNELDDHFISSEYLSARAKLKHTIDTK